MAYLRQRDFFLDVKMGLVTNYSSYKVSGLNTSVDASEEFLNALNALNLPTTYRVHSFSSSSTNDTALGTGARTISIKGNTSTGIQEETITMNGTTPVNTVNSYDFIIEIEVESAGSLTFNDGAITGVAATDATNTIRMLANEGEAYNGAFKCPAAHTAYLMLWTGDSQNSVSNNRTDFHLYKWNQTARHLEVHAKSVNQGSSDFLRDFSYSPLRLNDGEIFVMKALSSNSGSDTSADMLIILVKD